MAARVGSSGASELLARVTGRRNHRNANEISYECRVVSHRERWLCRNSLRGMGFWDLGGPHGLIVPPLLDSAEEELGEFVDLVLGE